MSIVGHVIFPEGYIIDSDDQPPTGFRSDWWKDLRLWRCRLGISRIFRDFQSRIWPLWICLNHGKHRGFGEVNQQVGRVRLWGPYSDWFELLKNEDVSTWHLYFQCIFKIFWQLWNLKSAGTYQQRALGLHLTSSTATTCIRAPQLFGALTATVKSATQEHLTMATQQPPTQGESCCACLFILVVAWCVVRVSTDRMEDQQKEFLLLLDAQEGLCMENSCVHCYAGGQPCDPADQSQRWYMRGRAIVNAHYGTCLEMDGGGNVVSRECHGERSQEWEFDVRGKITPSQDMQCMRFHPQKNNKIVYIDTCADVPEWQFRKLTEWPYFRNKPKDVASSCLDLLLPWTREADEWLCLAKEHRYKECPECPACSKCPECPACSKCPECPACSKCPECPACSKCSECPACSNSSNPDCHELVWLTLLICCGIGWIWKGSKGEERTGLNQQVQLDTMEASILQIDSTVTEIAAAIHGQTGRDGSDGSNSTVGSWTHVTSGQPCCFLQDTYFKVVTDDGEILKPANMLFRETRVIAADGTAIKVLYPPEQHQVDAVIKLQVGSAFLVVSPDHRILIPGNRTIQARELEVGSVVFLDGTEAELTSFEWNLVPTMVLKIAFQPDIPVAAFMCRPSILSLGSRNRPRVRRGTRTRTPQGGDALTIPDTEPPLTP